jgi:hypothetical protein
MGARSFTTSAGTMDSDGLEGSGGDRKWSNPAETALAFLD